MMNQQSLQWLVHHPVFHRDLRQARDMAEGRAATRKGRIDDDINLGYWMVRMPGLRMVRLRRVVWKDTWRDGADPSTLLAAHKVPWPLHSELYNITSGLWDSAQVVHVAALCQSSSPPCTSCSHARSQQPCILEVGVDTTLEAPACIRSPRKTPGCPKFARESHPSTFSPFC
jgi:hypothetical protein